MLELFFISVHLAVAKQAQRFLIGNVFFHSAWLDGGGGWNAEVMSRRRLRGLWQPSEHAT
jgi:hypothetical protein